MRTLAVRRSRFNVDTVRSLALPLINESNSRPRLDPSSWPVFCPRRHGPVRSIRKSLRNVTADLSQRLSRATAQRHLQSHEQHPRTAPVSGAPIHIHAQAETGMVGAGAGAIEPTMNLAVDSGGIASFFQTKANTPARHPHDHARLLIGRERGK